MWFSPGFPIVDHLSSIWDEFFTVLFCTGRCLVRGITHPIIDRNTENKQFFIFEKWKRKGLGGKINGTFNSANFFQIS